MLDNQIIKFGEDNYSLIVNGRSLADNLTTDQVVTLAKNNSFSDVEFAIEELFDMDEGNAIFGMNRAFIYAEGTESE